VKDERIDQLAKVLIHHSCELQAGERVLIEAFDVEPSDLVCRLVEEAHSTGAEAMVWSRDNRVLRALYKTGSQSGFDFIGKIEAEIMSKMDAYIGIRGSDNSEEMSDVPGEQLAMMQESIWKPVHIDIRVPKTKWVVLRYPTASFAQSARMSTEAFEDFYFDVCTADYAQMAKNQEPLKELMLATDHVRIVSPGTDLEFSIKDIPVVPCSGGRNIPDGEVFTAPIRESVNGVINYNAGSRYQGTIFENIRFEFENGKIINASCAGETARLNEILDSDEGARYIGEWSLGCNNRVVNPMMDTLFDEKIGGSMHLTPGQAYEEADNGNRSVVHWDLVLIQTPKYGGGELYFDGELVRKNGRFLPENLHPLNLGLDESE